MTVSEHAVPALDGAVYVDSNVFIFVFENASERAEKAEKLLASVATAGGKIVTSELTEAECCYKPAGEMNMALVSLYQEFFENSGEVNLAALTGNLVKEAAMIGGSLGLKLLDAIHYTTAVRAGCKTLVTGDLQFKTTPELCVLHI